MSESTIISAINKPVAEELESDVDLGTEGGADDFAAFISDQPIALRLGDVFKRLGQAEPKEYALYKMFEVWLVPHRFSLTRRKGNAEPVSVGIEVEYEHSGTTCSVVSLLPRPKWREHGKLAVGGSTTGKLTVSGEFAEEASAALTPTVQVGDLGFGVTGNGEVGFSFKWSVVTPTISAVGQGSSQCQWRFEKDEEPLFGQTIETWSALALPKRQKELTYRMRCYYITRTLFFPTRREGDFVTVRCQLAKG